MAVRLMRNHASSIAPHLMELLTIRPGCKKTAAKPLDIFRMGEKARRHPFLPVRSDIFRTMLTLPITLFFVAATAEELPDPTRPPPGIIAVPGDGRNELPPSSLQSIIISKARRAAIIDGETVELGGKHGDAKLIEVNEGNVVLLGAQGRQVMSLFPDVTITSKKVKAKLQSPAGKAESGKRRTRQAAPMEGK